MIIDPGLYSLNKSDIWWIIKQRNLPTSFKLYTGLISLQSLRLFWTLLMYVFANCKCFSSCSLHYTHAILSFLPSILRGYICGPCDSIKYDSVTMSCHKIYGNESNVIVFSY